MRTAVGIISAILVFLVVTGLIIAWLLRTYDDFEKEIKKWEEDEE